MSRFVAILALAALVAGSFGAVQVGNQFPAGIQIGADEVVATSSVECSTPGLLQKQADGAGLAICSEEGQWVRLASGDEVSNVEASLQSQLDTLVAALNGSVDLTPPEDTGKCRSPKEFTVNEETIGSAQNPSIATYADRTKYVVAYENDDPDGVTGDDIYYRRFFADGTPIDATDVRVNNNVTLNHQRDPYVAGWPGPDGGFAIVWIAWQSATDGSEYSVRVARIAANGTQIGLETQVNQHTEFDQEEPTVAVFHDGSGFAVSWRSYLQDGGGGWGMYSRVYDANVIPVTDEFVVADSPSGHQLYSDSIALDPSNYLVVWSSTGIDGSGYAVQGRRFSQVDGTPIGSEVTFNTYTTSTQRFPAVAISPDGTTLAMCWDSYEQRGSGKRYDIVARLFSASNLSPLTGEVQVNSYTVDDQRICDVDWYPEGDGLLMTWTSWAQNGDQRRGIYAQWFDANLAKRGSEFRVNQVTRDDQLNAVVAGVGVDNTFGSMMVVWQSYGVTDLVSYEAQARRFCPRTRCTERSQIQVNQETVDNQYWPDVAASQSADHYMVVWLSNLQDGSGLGVFGRAYSQSTNSPLTSEFQINTYTSSHQHRASVSPLGSNYVVVWYSNGQDSDSYGCYGQIVNSSGGKVGSEFKISQITTGTQQLPKVAAYPNGQGFVVVWESRIDLGAPESYDVYMRPFSSSGSALANEVKMNTVDLGDQRYPEVTVLDNSDYAVATWYSMANDTGADVYMQIYSTSNWQPVSSQDILVQAVSDPEWFHQYPSVIRCGYSSQADEFIVTWSAYSTNAAFKSSGWDVYARRFDVTGAALSDEWRVNTYLPSSQVYAKGSPLKSGQYVITWESWQQDGSRAGVYVQSYDRNDVPIGPEVAVNQVKEEEQGDPRVAGFRGNQDGGFVVTWASHGDDGDRWAVFSRTMCPLD